MSHDPALAWAGIAGVAVYGLLLTAWDPFEALGLRTGAWVVGSTDAFLITVFLVATGGWESPWFLLWYPSLVGLSVRLEPEETMAVATAYTGIYAGIALWDGALLANLGVFVVRMALLYGVGTMSVLVSDALLRESRQRQEYQDLAGHHAYQASLLESTLEATEDGVAVVDREGHVVLWNDRFEHLTGIPGSLLEEGGQPSLDRFADQVDEPGPDALRARVDEILAAPSEPSFDELRLEDGRILELYSHPQWVEEIVGRVWTLRDVTESTRLRDRLREQERRYHDLFEGVPVGLFETAVGEGDHLEVNEPLLKMLGYEDEEALREAGFATIWEDPGERDAFFEAVRREGEAEDTEATIRRADGSTIVARVDGEAVHGSEEPLVVRGALLDVTARKRMEEELRAYAHRLEDSNEDLEAFAHAVSHDLRNPLGGILGHLDLVHDEAREKLSPDGLESLETALDSAERMDRMIGDLLDFAKAHPEAEPEEPVDPDAVLDDVEADLAHRIREESAVVEVGDLPAVAVNRSQLLTIFSNLVANALRYRRAEEAPHILVRAEEAPDTMVRFHVEDNGQGIPEAEREEIFELFAQGSNGDPEGTGTGLATCERIVERYGGEIGVESTPGKGSTFHFTLPAATDPA